MRQERSDPLEELQVVFISNEKRMVRNRKQEAAAGRWAAVGRPLGDRWAAVR